MVSPHPFDGVALAPGTWVMAWFDTSGSVYREAERGESIDADDVGDADAMDWSWASPILNLSDIYDDFTFGGFAIDAHGSYSKTGSPAVINWSIYGGYGPYNLKLVDSGTYAYKFGTTSSRDLIGQKQDFSNIGIVLSGTDWVKLNGIQIFDSRTRARR